MSAAIKSSLSGSCFFILLLVSSSFAANVPAVITIPAERGDVTFRHADHQIRSKGQCVLCHHEGAGVHQCGSCHNGTSARPAQKVVHELCRGCHAELKNQNPPKACDDCHAKSG